MAKMIMYVALALMIAALALTHKKPICGYNSEQAVTLSEVQDMINNVSVGSVWFQHVGNSMYPTVKDGEKCECQRQATYRMGDIVVYYKLNPDSTIEFIAHRITEVLPIGYVTKGDNNKQVDYYAVAPEQVLCSVQQTSILDKLVAKVKG